MALHTHSKDNSHIAFTVSKVARIVSGKFNFKSGGILLDYWFHNINFHVNFQLNHKDFYKKNKKKKKKKIVEKEYHRAE